MIEILAEYPLLILFIVASLGYLVGTISIKGVSLGVSAILFTGLAVGAIDPRLQIPEIIFQLGLSIFIYSVGLTSGPAFFESYRKNGTRDILFLVSMLLLTGLMAVGIQYLLGFSPATITGIYSGSTTNTAQWWRRLCAGYRSGLFTFVPNGGFEWHHWYFGHGASAEDRLQKGSARSGR